jgi:hypothetical protein
MAAYRNLIVSVRHMAAAWNGRRFVDAEDANADVSPWRFATVLSSE